MNYKPDIIVPKNESFVDKYKPELLMAGGLAGLVFSVVWCGVATAKVVKLCEQKLMMEGKDKLSFKEKLKIAWKQYLPVVLSAGISIPCIILGNRVSSKRAAMLTAAYTLSNATLQQFQNKTAEVIGEKKAKEIKEQVVNEQISKSNSKTNSESKEVIINNDYEQLFYEELTGRYVKTSWNKLEAAKNKLNAAALASDNGSFSMNDWFEEIGLDFVKSGDRIGWGTPAAAMYKGILDIELGSRITKDNKVVAAIVYKVEPYYLY